MTLPNFPPFDEIAIAQNSDTKAVIQHQVEPVNPVAIAVGSGVGSVAIVTVIIELLKRFGGNAIENKKDLDNLKLREKELELEAEKQIRQAAIDESAKKTEKIYQILDLTLSVNRDSYMQLITNYYDSSKNIEEILKELRDEKERDLVTQKLLADILKVLSMHERG